MAVAIARTADPAGVASNNFVATYSSQSIGVAASDRIVVLLAATALANASPASATIDFGYGPVDMTVGALGNQGILYVRAFWLPVPQGTTAEFKITFANTMDPTASQNHVAVYRVTGATASPANSFVNDTDADPISTGSLTIAANGGMLMLDAHATAATARTWTGMAEDTDESAGAFRFTTGYSTTAGAVTTTVSGANQEDGSITWLNFASGSPPILLLKTDLAISAPVLTDATCTPGAGIDHLPDAAVLSVQPPVETAADLTTHYTFTGNLLSVQPPVETAPPLTKLLSAVALSVQPPVLTAVKITYNFGGQNLSVQPPVLTATGITYNFVGQALSVQPPVETAPTATVIVALPNATALSVQPPTEDAGTFTQKHVLAKTDLEVTAPSETAATFSQKHALAKVDLAVSAPSETAPDLTPEEGAGVDDLTPTNFTSASPTLEAVPDLSSWYAAGVDDLPDAAVLLVSAPVEASAIFAQTHALSKVDLAVSAPVETAATIGQLHTLTKTDLVITAPAETSATLGQTHALAKTDLAVSAPELQSQTLQENAPNVDNLPDAAALVVAAPVEVAPPLATSYTFTGQPLQAGTPSEDAATFGQKHALAKTDFAVSAPVLSAVKITYNLAGNALQAGAPVLDAVKVAYNFVGGTLQAGAPALATSKITYNVVGQALSITAPIEDAATIAQRHVLAKVDLAAGAPVLTAPSLSENAVGEIWFAERAIDYGLHALDAECDAIYLCSDLPTTYAEAQSMALGSKIFIAGDAFAPPEAGAPDGRKAVSALIADGDVDADGTAGYWAAVDETNGRLLASGPVNADRAVLAGQKFTLDAFAVHLPAEMQ